MTRLAGSSRLLRAINEGAALAHLLDSGPLTRGDLRQLTGLSKPTTSEVMRRLQEAGLAVVVGRTSGGPGPNAELYGANPDAAFVAGVSVRDNSLSIAVCDLTGSVRVQDINVQVDFRWADPVEAVAAEVAAICRGAGISLRRLSHVQLGVQGSYDRSTDTIRYVDTPGWGRSAVVDALRRRMRCPVGLDNDVNLAAVAERNHGCDAARAGDQAGFAMLWLGDGGLGLAIDLGGTLLRGARGGAGEIGYMRVGLDGHDYQDLVGGAAVRALAREYGFRGRVASNTVARAVAAADGAARDFLNTLAQRIAVGLAAVVAVLDPPLVVLGGEVGQAGGEALCQAVSAAFEHAAPLETTIAATGVTGDAVLLGALDAGRAAVRAHLLGAGGIG